jgi:outer membrane murein-binding lipoprotein Lpp
MKARTKFFHAVATCLLFAVATSALGLTGGCGDANAPPDEATKAKIQELEAKVREVHAKKSKPDTSAGPTRKKRM